LPLALWQEVERLLACDWSPVQISSRLEQEQGVGVSHEWIYHYIYANRGSGGRLYRHLRCQKLRRKRYGQYDRRGRLAHQQSIDKRLASVNSRRQLGHWEGDTLRGSGARRAALVSLTERKSRYTVLGHISACTAAATRRELVARLKPHAPRVLSLSCDNGKEFAEHGHIANKLHA
jgi:IS30 family transposase